MSTSLRDVVFDAPIQRAFSLLSEIMPYAYHDNRQGFWTMGENPYFRGKKAVFLTSASFTLLKFDIREFVVRFLTNESEGR